MAKTKRHKATRTRTAPRQAYQRHDTRHDQYRIAQQQALTARKAIRHNTNETQTRHEYNDTTHETKPQRNTASTSQHNTRNETKKTASTSSTTHSTKDATKRATARINARQNGTMITKYISSSCLRSLYELPNPYIQLKQNG